MAPHVSTPALTPAVFAIVVGRVVQKLNLVQVELGDTPISTAVFAHEKSKTAYESSGLERISSSVGERRDRPSSAHGDRQ